MTTKGTPSARRQELRYRLRLPVAVDLTGDPQRITAQSQNISVHGILFNSQISIPVGSSVKVAVPLGSQPAPGGLSLRAVGTVLRVENTEAGAFAVAVSCPGAFRIARTRRPAET